MAMPVPAQAIDIADIDGIWESGVYITGVTKHLTARNALKYMYVCRLLICNKRTYYTMDT